MTKLFANPRFLVVYSGALTVIFAVTVIFWITRGLIFARAVSGAEHKNWRHADFDQLTVHRINVVEADGTPRLIISNAGEYPGSFYRGKEQDGSQRSSGLRLWDNGSGLITPEAVDAIEQAKRLPVDTPEHRVAAQKVFDVLLTKYPIKEIPRAISGATWTSLPYSGCRTGRGTIAFCFE